MGDLLARTFNSPAPAQMADIVGRRLRSADSSQLRLAVVNNMPDSAFVATERQFARLVRNASGGKAQIDLYYMPSVARGDDIRQVIAQRYRPIQTLYAIGADRIIVTGTEPRAAHLVDEPFWRALTTLVDWARAHGCASLWSCLAAHAAVLHLDGIERRRLPHKKSGVLTCMVHSDFAGMPERLAVCHSRMNGLLPEMLHKRGYGIVSDAPGGHVDMFAKTEGGHFLFLQGHPEYDADSLMREYRRDVGRYLSGQREVYPEFPENYFDAATTARMENYRSAAERLRDIRIFDSFPAATLRADLGECLAGSAAAVFRYWLAGHTVARARV